VLGSSALEGTGEGEIMHKVGELEINAQVGELNIKTKVDDLLNRRPAVGLAVGVVRNGSIEFFHGHGLADIASHTPVTEDTVFRIASITKTFTAIAVMQLGSAGLSILTRPPTTICARTD
jgi:Beta-lactamase